MCLCLFVRKRSAVDERLLMYAYAACASVRCKSERVAAREGTSEIEPRRRARDAGQLTFLSPLLPKQ